jgi:hypothetical protein
MPGGIGCGGTFGSSGIGVGSPGGSVGGSVGFGLCGSGLGSLIGGLPMACLHCSAERATQRAKIGSDESLIV